MQQPVFFLKRQGKLSKLRLYRICRNFCYIVYMFAFGTQRVKTFVNFKENLLFQNTVELMFLYLGKNVKQMLKLTGFFQYTQYTKNSSFRLQNS